MATAFLGAGILEPPSVVLYSCRVDEAARARKREYDRIRRSSPEAKAREVERRRRYYLANQERAKATAKAVYYADPEKARARTREYYTRPGVRARQSEYFRKRNADPEVKARYAVRQQQWIAANQHRRTDAEARRRAFKSGANSERISRKVVWETSNGVCHICQRPADPTNWHLDHVIPLSRGGDHTYANVAVSHPLCNMRKHARDPRTA
jgi:5-methylcytosine-specific restriction endonuclease McrA